MRTFSPTSSRTSCPRAAIASCGRQPPGWIHSGTDFFITDAGLVGSETTIGHYEGFDTNGVPEFVRMRRATQDAASLDQWCEIMKRGNNGGYANAWLLGDVNTKEIARLELALKHVAFEKKRDGCFTGSNLAEDLKILRLETESEETDIRASSVARRVRWRELMKNIKLGRLTWPWQNASKRTTSTLTGGKSGPAGAPFAVISTSTPNRVLHGRMSLMSAPGRWTPRSWTRPGICAWPSPPAGVPPAAPPSSPKSSLPPIPSSRR